MSVYYISDKRFTLTLDDEKRYDMDINIRSVHREINVSPGF